MFKRFINWIKSLFLSCLGYDNSVVEAEEHEVLPLQASENEQEEARAERSDSTGDILEALKEPPVTLTDAEIKLILYYGQNGINEYIDKLEPKKKELAYALLNERVHDHIVEIDAHMSELLNVNKNTNRLEASWKRIKQHFLCGEASDYSLAQPLESFKDKSIDENDPHKDTQVNIIDQITSCFQSCKAILNLHIFKHKLREANITIAPSKEEIKIELYREETQLNRKTLDAVNDFNKRSDDYWREAEAEAEEKMHPRKYRMGGRK